MRPDQLDRINELAKKKKTVGLTPEEKTEQTALRAEYIAGFRESLRGQLDSITIVEKDGSTHKLKHTPRVKN